MRKLLFFFLAISLTSCTHYKTISYVEAKMVNGKLTFLPGTKTTKVHLGQIHWLHKNTRFQEGQTVNIITK